MFQKSLSSYCELSLLLEENRLVPVRGDMDTSTS